jgi:hypothetical protein
MNPITSPGRDPSTKTAEAVKGLATGRDGRPRCPRQPEELLWRKVV